MIISLSLRFKLSSSVSLFFVIWVCRFVILVGFVELFFRFVVIDFLNRWFFSLGLYLIFVFSIEIKANCCPLEPDLTQPVAFYARQQVWNFSTQFDWVGCKLGTNPTWTDPWTALPKKTKPNRYVLNYIMLTTYSSHHYSM